MKKIFLAVSIAILLSIGMAYAGETETAKLEQMKFMKKNLEVEYYKTQGRLQTVSDFIGTLNRDIAVMEQEMKKKEEEAKKVKEKK